MIKMFQVLLFSIVLSPGLMAQNFVNGDLEGTVSGYSTVPPSWQVVDFNDINCQGDAGGITPDLVSTTQPSPSSGAIGSPYSGNTFAGGSHGISSASGTNFHEGIQQTLNGFTIGEEYKISFYQAVVKTEHSLDPTGSWMVIFDDSIIGVTAPTTSTNNYSSISFAWESRQLSFTATANSHVIKFLPLDDDNDLMSGTSNNDGALYMGIDAISIEQTTFSGLKKNEPLDAVKVFPNPSTGLLHVKIKNEQLAGQLTIYNSTGVSLISKKIKGYDNLINLADYPSGVYLLKIQTESKIITRTVVKQ